MGRPIKYFTEEERKQAHKEAKTRWRCPACYNYNYTLAGKWMHLKTKKHVKNAQAINDKEN